MPRRHYFHAFGIPRVSYSMCIAFACRPLRTASWISGASIVSRNSRLTKLRPIFSASRPAQGGAPQEVKWPGL
jgi:hypothetical protein